jgi:predicted ArsR family transcriptional regulator
LADIQEIASSRPRLTIASLISSRPRTLGELAETTGISVQGVLKHLRRLSDAGLVRAVDLPSGRHLRARKLYRIDSRKVSDYSEGDTIVATLATTEADGEEDRDGGEGRGPDDPYAELDRLAQDVIMLRRRASELSERMNRAMREVARTEVAIAALIDGLDLSPEERQIAYLIFGDDGPEQARRTLRQHYGCLDPEEAIRDVTQRMRKGGPAP